MEKIVICPKCKAEIAELIEKPKHGSPLTPDNFRNMRQTIRVGKPTICEECGELWHHSGKIYIRDKGWT